MQMELLYHHQPQQAQEILKLWRRSYQVEADLIGVLDFPPLRRTWEEIAASTRFFVGCRFAERLVGLAEYSIEQGVLEISSLIVDPEYFRQGYASKLMGYLLAQNDWFEAIVDTAQANMPAISLYQKWGFIETNRWLPEHGIPIVRLSRGPKA